MKTVTNTVLVSLAAATPAIAATTGTNAGHGLLLTAFIGFAALIVAFQFVPAVVLFGAMLKGLFFAGKESTRRAEEPRK